MMETNKWINPKIGFIGFGEVSYYMAKGLKEAGIKEIYAYARALADPERSDAVRKRGEEAGAVLYGDIKSLMDKSDIVFSSVHGHVSLQIAEQAAAHIRKGTLFADLNNAVPEDKRKASELITEKGAAFIDVGLLGLPIQNGHRSLIYVSGNGASMFKEIMEPYGMRITLVPGEAGKAASIKALANIYMKGLQGVCLELAMSAVRADIDLEILEPLLVDPVLSLPREKDMGFWIIRGALLAERKKAEMAEAVKMLKGLGVEPLMLEAAVKRFDHISKFEAQKYFEADMKIDDYKEIIDKIISVGKEKGIELK